MGCTCFQVLDNDVELGIAELLSRRQQGGEGKEERDVADTLPPEGMHGSPRRPLVCVVSGGRRRRR